MFVCAHTGPREGASPPEPTFQRESGAGVVLSGSRSHHPRNRSWQRRHGVIEKTERKEAKKEDESARARVFAVRTVVGSGASESPAHVVPDGSACGGV